MFYLIIDAEPLRLLEVLPEKNPEKAQNEIIRSDVKGTKVSKDPVKDKNVLKLFIKKAKLMQNGTQML